MSRGHQQQAQHHFYDRYKGLFSDDLNYPSSQHVLSQPPPTQSHRYSPSLFSASPPPVNLFSSQTQSHKAYSLKNRQFLQQFNQIAPSRHLTDLHSRQRQQYLDSLERNLLSEHYFAHQKMEPEKYQTGAPNQLQMHNYPNRRYQISRGSPIPDSLSHQRKISQLQFSPSSQDSRLKSLSHGGVGGGSVSHHNSSQLRNVFQHSLDGPVRRSPDLKAQGMGGGGVLSRPTLRMPPMTPSYRRNQTERSNSESPRLHELKIYEKPVNQQYHPHKFQEMQANAHNLNRQFDIKNLDIKTDGTVVQYKPEYHASQVQSAARIFPWQREEGGEGAAKEERLGTPVLNEKRLREARQRRETAKMRLERRKQKVAALLEREGYFRGDLL